MSADVRAVTVDLDDTLFPQKQWLDGAWETVAARAGSLGLDGSQLLSALVAVAAEGSDRGRIIDRALLRVGVDPGPYVDTLVDAFLGHAPERLRPYPGSRPALARLRATVRVVLLTDGDPRVQRAKLAALRLDRALDGVVVSDELGGRSVRKPSPVPFLAALDLLQLPANRVVHIGDRPAKDVAGAQGVGMRCVRVRTGEYAGLPDPPGLRPWRTVGAFADAVDLLAGSLEGTPRASARL